MIEVKKEGILLSRTNLDFESRGVLNPALTIDEKGIHLFYRAVGADRYSTIGYCRLRSPLELSYRKKQPVLFGEFGYESHGVEDPRIVRIDESYYLTYTAYDGVNALGALALSGDLLSFRKQGLQVPRVSYESFVQLTSSSLTIDAKYERYNVHGGIHKEAGKKVFVWDKNLIFFPRRINGKLVFLHRIRPDIQLVSVESLEDLSEEFWIDYFRRFDENVLMRPKYAHESSYIGGGCPPIETSQGWLIIYHGVEDTVEGYIYSACAALLDLENPLKELARLPYALFRPDQVWEQKGEVNNICFPTGSILLGDTLYIYYGAADEQIACASLSVSDLIDELISNIKSHE